MTQSCQKPDPQHGKLQLGEISQIGSISLRTEGSVPHIRHPNLWDLHWRDDPHRPKHLPLKTNRAYVQENQSAIGNGDSTLKGLKRRLAYPRTQWKSSNMKSAQTICERDSFANLKAAARGPGACWDSQGQRHW